MVLAGEPAIGVKVLRKVVLVYYDEDDSQLLGILVDDIT